MIIKPNRKLSILLGFLIMLNEACQKPTTIKDLDECMIDLKAYQQNMGDLVKEGRLQDAEWLLQGADSLLQVMSNTFTRHRKLEHPFSYFYKTKLKKPLKEIEEAISKNDTAQAIKHYRILVNRCNGCHIDHDIDKKVIF